MGFGREEFDKIAAHIKANPANGFGIQEGNERHVLYVGRVEQTGHDLWLVDVHNLRGEWKRSSLALNMAVGFNNNPVEMAVIDADHPGKVQVKFTPENPVWQREVVESRLKHMASKAGRNTPGA
jgi:hypothetical protein